MRSKRKASLPPAAACAAVSSEESLVPAVQSGPTKGVTLKKTDANQVTLVRSKTLEQVLDDVCSPAGVQDEEVAIRLLDQVGASLRRPKPATMDDLIIQSAATMREIGPKGGVEAMLAAQMIATHEASMHFMALATRDDQTFQGRDANVLRASRLMRLHLDQIEAMQKLKGKACQQTVTVEHVHVHDGGQAIVGAVTAPVRGEGDGTGK